MKSNVPLEITSVRRRRMWWRSKTAAEQNAWLIAGIALATTIVLVLFMRLGHLQQQWMSDCVQVHTQAYCEQVLR